MEHEDKCKCYYEAEEVRYLEYYSYPPIKKVKKVGRCSGTKECEVCACGGDRRICDFYDYVRVNARSLEETPVESKEALEKKEADLQPEFLKVAVDGLIKFRHAFCYDREDSEKTDDLTFRCSDCQFKNEDGYCSIKLFIKEHGTKKQKRESEVLAR